MRYLSEVSWSDWYRQTDKDRQTNTEK